MVSNFDIYDCVPSFLFTNFSSPESFSGETVVVLAAVVFREPLGVRGVTGVQRTPSLQGRYWFSESP